LGLAFFGLTPSLAPQIRINLFRQIHQIIFHGKGGYDHHTVYNMPLWLRKFTFSEIQKFYDDEKEAQEKPTSGKSNLINSDGTVNAPDFKKASQDYKGRSSYK